MARVARGHCFGPARVGRDALGGQAAGIEDRAHAAIAVHEYLRLEGDSGDAWIPGRAHLLQIYKMTGDVEAPKAGLFGVASWRRRVGITIIRRKVCS